MHLLLRVVLGTLLGGRRRRLAALLALAVALVVGARDLGGPDTSSITRDLRDARDGANDVRRGLEGIPDRLARDASVVRAVDGDTLLVTVGGSRERVRVLGIDTPETVRPGAPVDCFGPQASAATTAWVADHPRVRLARDGAAPDRDRFGRLLRHVGPADGGGADLSTVLVRAGAARVRSYGQDLRGLGALERAESRARQAGAGLWGACRG